VQFIKLDKTKSSHKPYSEVRMQLAGDIPDLIRVQTRDHRISHTRDTCTLQEHTQITVYINK